MCLPSCWGENPTPTLAPLASGSFPGVMPPPLPRSCPHAPVGTPLPGSPAVTACGPARGAHPQFSGLERRLKNISYSVGLSESRGPEPSEGRVLIPGRGSVLPPAAGRAWVWRALHLAPLQAALRSQLRGSHEAVWPQRGREHPQQVGETSGFCTDLGDPGAAPPCARQSRLPAARVPLSPAAQGGPWLCGAPNAVPGDGQLWDPAGALSTRGDWCGFGGLDQEGRGLGWGCLQASGGA